MTLTNRQFIPGYLAASIVLGLARTAAAQVSSAPPAALPVSFVIGPEASDSHSHASFPGLPHDVVKVSARVRVTNAIGQGLNFFAIQVNFPNNTWAHGGPQLVNGKYQINWGGLVNRGGGSADYRKENPAADLQLMQNAPDIERNQPYAWTVGAEYVLIIERDKPLTLPPGEYIFIGSGPRVQVDTPRTMWKWTFTVKPAGQNEPDRVAVLYNTADRIASFYIWNECGYGSCDKGQSATWSMPVFSRLANPDKEIQTQVFKRF